MQWLYIAIGGTTGALARYFIATLVYKFTGTHFPWGTIAVNVLGCLGIGVFVALDATRFMFSHEVKLLIATGFFGAFTTFSALILESSNLHDEGFLLKALLNILVSVAVGFIAFRCGLLLARAV